MRPANCVGSSRLKPDVRRDVSNRSQIKSFTVVRLVGSSLFPQFTHNRVLGVDFHGLFGDHVRCHGVITQSLGFHDTFHVGRPPMLRGGKYTRRISHARAHHNFFDLVSQDLLHQFCEWLEFGFQLLDLFLFILVIDIKAFLGHRLQFLAIEFFQLLDTILVDRVNHVEHFETLLPQRFKEWGG